MISLSGNTWVPVIQRKTVMRSITPTSAANLSYRGSNRSRSDALIAGRSAPLLSQCFSWPMRSHLWQKLGCGPSGMRSTYLRGLLCTSRNISQGFITCDCSLNSQSMLMNQQFFTSCVHFNGNFRLPLTVQGASGRSFCSSSSDLKVTSQREDDYKPPSEQLSSVAGGIVALGKFDALHVGHRELATQAAKAGAPFLLSFVGMAEVLGWEPRAPVVAQCDRKRVLSSWAPYCGEVTPVEFQVEFSKVRSLTPRQFVEKLSKKLGVRGVVAGKNYRFGYRASGDASELVRLCEEYELEAYIINPVMDKNQSFPDTEYSNSKEQGQVSSTRVRHALSKGEMRYVSELLGRQHRLMLKVNDQLRFTSSKSKLSSPKSSLLNLPPKDGIYENCCIMIGKENVIPCRVVIDTTDIHVELVDVATWTDFPLGELTFLSIEFR